jgi:hypothetical protein
MTDHPANVDRVALMFWIVAGVAAGTGARERPRMPRFRRTREPLVATRP